MVVKIIKTKVEKINQTITNHDMSHSLVIGSIYIVYGIEVNTENIYYIIFNGNHLLFIPAQMFEIIDNSIPDSWKLKFDRNILTLYPELFYLEYFFDRFSDYDDDLRDEFEKIK